MPPLFYWCTAAFSGALLPPTTHIQHHPLQWAGMACVLHDVHNTGYDCATLLYSKSSGHKLTVIYSIRYHTDLPLFALRCGLCRLMHKDKAVYQASFFTDGTVMRSHEMIK